MEDKKSVLKIQNSRKRNRISFFIGLDFKVFSKRGSRETAALVFACSVSIMPDAER